MYIDRKNPAKTRGLVLASPFMQYLSAREYACARGYLGRKRPAGSAHKTKMDDETQARTEMAGFRRAVCSASHSLTSHSSLPNPAACSHVSSSVSPSSQ